MARRRARVESALRSALPAVRSGDLAAPVARAMREAVLGGGKRLRPILVMLVGEMFGARFERVRGLAVCVELLHASSLVLDDLPAMDDAKLRRGRPALHRVVGEATAILAADSLLVLAFEALTTLRDAPPRVLVDLVSSASRTVGHHGMIGGQQVDLTELRHEATREVVDFVERHKTAKLFELSASGAARLCGAKPAEVRAVSAFARNLGVAFQISDDILDATRPASLGKEGRQDAGKTTLVSLTGVAGARAAMDGLLATATRALAPFGPRAGRLAALAESVRSRALA